MENLLVVLFTFLESLPSYLKISRTSFSYKNLFLQAFIRHKPLFRVHSELRNFSAMPTERGESLGSAEQKLKRNRDPTFSFFPLQSESSLWSFVSDEKSPEIFLIALTREGQTAPTNFAMKFRVVNVYSIVNSTVQSNFAK